MPTINLITHYQIDFQNHSHDSLTFTTLGDVKRYLLGVMQVNKLPILTQSNDLKANELLSFPAIIHVVYPDNHKYKLYIFLDRNQRIITINQDHIQNRGANRYATPRGSIKNSQNFQETFRIFR